MTAGFPSHHDVRFALLGGIAGVAGSYVAAGYSRAFVVAPIDDLVVKTTPGPIVAWTITTIGDAGHLLHVALSVLIASVLLAAPALLGLLVVHRTWRTMSGVGVAGVTAWSVAAAITGTPFLAVGAALPVAVFTGLGARTHTTPEHDPERRALISSVGAIGLFGLAVGLRRLASTAEPADGATGTAAMDTDGEVDALLDEAESKALDIEGDVPGLVSTFEEFYNVDIAEFDPELAPEDWTLTITGAVGDDVTIDFDDLTARPTEHRFVTLRCVGESLNGKKLDTAVWTGTPIKPLLDEVDPESACGCAMLHAEDGYYVQFPIEALADGFLAWGMNGQALPRSHGHPVRVLVPGHWGETNVKWLTEIELLDEAVDGYWEERGWHGTGPVNTVAKLWSDVLLEDGTLEVAGHAYAGTRGVDRVEVSTDGGDTWADAILSDPLPGDDVWRQWRYAFEPEGTHDVVVRAIDGSGAIQPEDRSDAFPSGATGWVSRRLPR